MLIFALGFIGYGVGLNMDGVGGHGAWQWYVITLVLIYDKYTHII